MVCKSSINVQDTRDRQAQTTPTPKESKRLQHQRGMRLPAVVRKPLQPDWLPIYLDKQESDSHLAK